MASKEIGSINGFISAFNKIPKDKNCEYFYRGHPDYSYKLRPSIYRKSIYINNEDKIFKEIISKTPTDFSNEHNTIEKLVKMQHYNLPTRLLDITSNPLVALYFACSGNEVEKKKDGEVLLFKIPKNEIKFYDSDTVTIISNLSRRPINFNVSEPSRKLFNGLEIIQQLIHDIRDDKSHFQSIINPADLNKVLTVKVKLNNARIIKQSGVFFLFGINGEKVKPAVIPNNWETIKFRISKGRKTNILTELNKLAINESTLFPEIENQAKYLLSSL